MLRTSAFVRAAKKVLKVHPNKKDDFRFALDLLATDAFDPRLKTHKLKGVLTNCWASSVGYEMRIVFKLVEHEGQEAILLMTIGSHEEVY